MRTENTIRSLFIDFEKEAVNGLNDDTHERFTEWSLLSTFHDESMQMAMYKDQGNKAFQ